MQEQSSPPSLSIEERLSRKVAEMEGKLDVRESSTSKLANLDQRMDVAEAKEKQQQEKSLEKEISPEKSIGRGFGIER